MICRQGFADASSPRPRAITTARSSRAWQRTPFRAPPTSSVSATHVCRAAGSLGPVAIVLDAWSRLIVGYRIGRSIDARLMVAALTAAIDRRRPPPDCIHHSDGIMKTKMTHAMRMELANAIRGRYAAAASKDKRRILEEFIAATGYHDKSAIRILNIVSYPYPEQPAGAEEPADPSTPVAL